MSDKHQGFRVFCDDVLGVAGARLQDRVAFLRDTETCDYVLSSETPPLEIINKVRISSHCVRMLIEFELNVCFHSGQPATCAHCKH